MKKMKTKIFPFFLIAAMLNSMVMVGFADESSRNSDCLENIEILYRNDSVSQNGQNADFSPYQGTPVQVLAESFLPDSTSVQVTDIIDGKTAVITGESGQIIWEVEVPQDGLYAVNVCYYPVEGHGGTIERHFTVNGEIVSKDFSFLAFNRIWKDEIDASDFEKDSRGNEIRPSQVESPRWVNLVLSDSTGYQQTPLTISLTAGVHRIALESVKEPLAIAYVELVAPQTLLTYDEYSKNIAGKAEATAQYIEIPAEHALEKSDSSLYAITDRTSPMTNPQDPSKIRLNTIGGSKWQNVGQKLTWEFYVEQDGYYHIALRFKKDLISGMFASRSLKIDDEILFEEVSALRFNYKGGWQLYDLGDENGTYSFYLEKGSHTVTMEVVLGDVADILGRTEDCLSRLNAIYRHILMITGL
ncbi:MAG: hypothetical protein IJY82_03780 [Oscillospiraceae bacterium]|nr:hypothetical protein [Oscillospiraceae bacterium]